MKKFVSVMNGTVSLLTPTRTRHHTVHQTTVENSRKNIKETTDISEFKAQATNRENSATILLVEDNEQIYTKYLAGKSAEHFSSNGDSHPWRKP